VRLDASLRRRLDLVQVELYARAGATVVLLDILLLL
jgi:hypothetical protein